MGASDGSGGCECLGRRDAIPYCDAVSDAVLFCGAGGLASCDPSRFLCPADGLPVGYCVPTSTNSSTQTHSSTEQALPMSMGRPQNTSCRMCWSKRGCLRPQMKISPQLAFEQGNALSSAPLLGRRRGWWSFVAMRYLYSLGELANTIASPGSDACMFCTDC